jgi:hypothetical protein
MVNRSVVAIIDNIRRGSAELFAPTAKWLFYGAVQNAMAATSRIDDDRGVVVAHGRCMVGCGVIDMVVGSEEVKLGWMA